jgi:hypothetical protein
MRRPLVSKKNVRGSMPHDLEVMRPVDYPRYWLWVVAAIIIAGLIALFLID